MTIEELRAQMCIPAEASKNDITNRFAIIAEAIKNECVIKYRNDEYRILDFEFYYYNRNHQDISVHPRNSQALCWYINDFGGIDLNFESRIKRDKEFPFKYCLTDQSYFGGILIRQIQNINNNMVFDGPWKVAELFRTLNATSHQQDNPILDVLDTKHLPSIGFKEPLQRHNLLGSRKGDLEYKAKEKADYNIRECFTGVSEPLKHKLETELVSFSKEKYRYCWKSE